VTAIPAGTGITARCEVSGWRGARVHVANVGSGACEVVGVAPDGGDHMLRPGRRLAIDLVDGSDPFIVCIRSRPGTAVRIEAKGTVVPLVRGVKKTVVRDPTTKLITHVVETPVWMPAP
jgi:hypothetical protein